MSEEEYVPKDRTGYSVLFVDGPSPYWVVTREADGTGIGAYHSDETIDNAVAVDREYLKSVEVYEATKPVLPEPVDNIQPTDTINIVNKV